MNQTEKQIIEETFENLNSYDLSENQRSFLKSLQKYYKRNKKLSDRQFQILREIREHAEVINKTNNDLNK